MIDFGESLAKVSYEHWKFPKHNLTYHGRRRAVVAGRPWPVQKPCTHVKYYGGGGPPFV